MEITREKLSELGCGFNYQPQRIESNPAANSAFFSDIQGIFLLNHS
jgi:hypothetical protein